MEWTMPPRRRPRRQYARSRGCDVVPRVVEGAMHGGGKPPGHDGVERAREGRCPCAEQDDELYGKAGELHGLCCVGKRCSRGCKHDLSSGTDRGGGKDVDIFRVYISRYFQNTPAAPWVISRVSDTKQLAPPGARRGGGSLEGTQCNTVSQTLSRAWNRSTRYPNFSHMYECSASAPGRYPLGASSGPATVASVASVG